MVETIRDVVVRIGLKQIDAKLKVPNTEPIAKGFKQIEDQAKKAQIEVRKTGTETQDAMLKAGESFKAAGQGAFTLARGIAFMSASSDEDFQKMIRTIAAIQGGFDVFAGTIETIKGVTEGIRAWRVATIAATSANAALAVSNVAVASTATGVIAAVAPIVLAVAAAGGVFFILNRETAAANKELDKIGKTVEASSKGLGRIAEQSSLAIDGASTVVDALEIRARAMTDLVTRGLEDIAKLRSSFDASTGSTILTEQQEEAIIKAGVLQRALEVEEATSIRILEIRKDQLKTKDDEIKKIEQGIRLEAEGLLTAEEKFANLTNQEKRKVRGAKARIDRGAGTRADEDLVSRIAPSYITQRRREALTEGQRGFARGLGGLDLRSQAAREDLLGETVAQDPQVKALQKQKTATEALIKNETALLDEVTLLLLNQADNLEDMQTKLAILQQAGR